MALPVWQATIVNRFGDIIPSATITVIVESTGLPATLYSDRNGTVPLGSGGVFNANTSGFAQFFTDPDNYRIKAEQSSSGFSQTWDFVVLSGSSSLKDAQTSPTDSTAGRVVTTDALGDNGGPIWTDANLNPRKFGGKSGRTAMVSGRRASTTNICVFNPVTMLIAGQVPASISVVGTFSLINETTGATEATGIQTGITLSAVSGGQQTRILVSPAITLSATDSYRLSCDSDGSIITVNV